MKILKELWRKCILNNSQDKNSETKSKIQIGPNIEKLNESSLKKIMTLGLDSLNYLRAANRNVDDKFSKLINLTFTFLTITVGVIGILLSAKPLNATKIPIWLFILMPLDVFIFLLLIVILIQRISLKKGQIILSFGEFVNQIINTNSNSDTHINIRTLQAIDELILEEYDWNQSKTKHHFCIYALFLVFVILSLLIILGIAVM